jgi:hypothetical protein
MIALETGFGVCTDGFFYMQVEFLWTAATETMFIIQSFVIWPLMNLEREREREKWREATWLMKNCVLNKISPHSHKPNSCFFRWFDVYPTMCHNLLA